jgi:hypothetical protein
LLALPGNGSAQNPPGSTAPAAQSVPQQPDYHPCMGDLMTMAIQPRHIKLGLAGRKKNWTYAEYELAELRNAFGRVARTIPTYRTTDMSALVSALMTEPLNAAEEAIRADDPRRFATAYAQITTACNACHLSQGHPMVVIRIPSGNAYADQDFEVPGR